jgi:hypothetical protein
VVAPADAWCRSKFNVRRRAIAVYGMFLDIIMFDILDCVISTYGESEVGVAAVERIGWIES